MENVDFLKAHSTKLGITGDHKKYPHDLWALELFLGQI